MKSVISTSIYVRQCKGYVATIGDCEIADVITEPIYIVNLSMSELTEAIEKVFHAGTPRLPRPPGDKLYNLPKPDPLLKAAKVSSWKKFAQGAAAYSITWRSNDIIVYMSRPNSKFEWDHPTKTRYFSPHTDIKIIVQAILDDVRSRHELQS